MNPEPTVTNTFGAQLIGAFFAICLFGVALVQVVHYFETFHDDRWPFKLLVMTICLLETAHSMAIMYDIYETNVVYNPRSQVADMNEFKGVLLATVFGGVITLLVQSFFAYRVYRLLPNPWRFIGPFCVVLATVRAVGSIFLAARGFHSQSLNTYSAENDWLVTSLLSADAFIDLVIATSMMYYLARQRGHVLNRCGRVIDKLILWTVSFGLITSLVAIGMLLAFQLAPRTSYWKALFSILGKLYSIGILSTLNGRQKLRNLLSATTTIDFEALNSHRRSTATRTSLPTTIIFKPRCEAPNHIEMNRGTEIVTDSIPDTPAIISLPEVPLPTFRPFSPDSLVQGSLRI